MAIKKCKECGQAVSTKANACPHCGAKDPLGRAGKGCLIATAVLGGFVVLVVIIVAVGILSEDKPPMPYKMGEVFDLAPHKWQVDVVVEAPDGTLEQGKLEALARFIAAQKEASLGKVKRWWVSFYLPNSDKKKGPVAVIGQQDGKVEFQWAPRNYPPGFKGSAK